jgi:hypothetical protein
MQLILTILFEFLHGEWGREEENLYPKSQFLLILESILFKRPKEVIRLSSNIKMLLLESLMLYF